MMTEAAPIEKSDKITPADSLLAIVRDMVRPCIQCGTCTASCPNADNMDLTPRMLWRMILMGQKEAVFKSKTFALCSACYYCTLRCPRGLQLTEAMNILKQIATMEDAKIFRQSKRFYGSFLESVRRHGRVREMEMMSLYFIAMKNPMVPFKYAGLGVKLMGKGKVTIQFPFKGTSALDKIFKKTSELEIGS